MVMVLDKKVKFWKSLIRRSSNINLRMGACPSCKIDRILPSHAWCLLGVLLPGCSSDVPWHVVSVACEGDVAGRGGAAFIVGAHAARKQSVFDPSSRLPRRPVSGAWRPTRARTWAFSLVQWHT